MFHTTYSKAALENLCPTYRIKTMDKRVIKGEIERVCVVFKAKKLSTFDLMSHLSDLLLA